MSRHPSVSCDWCQTAQAPLSDDRLPHGWERLTLPPTFAGYELTLVNAAGLVEVDVCPACLTTGPLPKALTLALELARGAEGRIVIVPTPGAPA
jgi:hypothetical protein